MGDLDDMESGGIKAECFEKTLIVRDLDDVMKCGNCK